MIPYGTKVRATAPKFTDHHTYAPQDFIVVEPANPESMLPGYVLLMYCKGDGDSCIQWPEKNCHIITEG